MVRSVFVLQHLHFVDGCDDIKLIGVYSSLSSAQKAVERLRTMPGFRDYPLLINPLVDDEEEGFYIDAYTLDQDHWNDGFETVP